MKYELDKIKGYGRVKLAMAFAIATKQNLLVFGSPTSKRDSLVRCINELLEPMTDEEKAETEEMHRMANILSEDEKLHGMKNIRPFRHPHYTASLEGIFGGGANLRCGEISLAHNGVLFLEDVMEFKTSILQTLRIPLVTKEFILSRAGRSKTFPANFQLVMTANNCPCGNYGEEDKICLCSAKSIEQYWKKLSPLMNSVLVRVHADENDKTDFFVDELKNLIQGIKSDKEFQKNVLYTISDKIPYDEITDKI